MDGMCLGQCLNIARRPLPCRCRSAVGRGGDDIAITKDLMADPLGQGSQYQQIPRGPPAFRPAQQGAHRLQFGQIAGGSCRGYACYFGIGAST